MEAVTRSGLNGLFFLAFLSLAACSDSSGVADNPESETPQTPANPEQDNAGDNSAPVDSGGGNSDANPQPDTSVDQNPPQSESEPMDAMDAMDGTNNTDTNTDNNPVETGSGDEDPNTTDSPPQPDNNNNNTDTTPETPLSTSVATGADSSGSEDDSPTGSESQSLVGPFIRDESRPAGPPSVPENLTLLLSAENWLEFSWAPSSDDQSVEAYEMYRDGNLLYTIRGNNEQDYGSWITTTYTDCNYTRYAQCQGNQPATGGSHNYTVVAIDNEGMRSAPSQPATFRLNTIQNSQVDLSGYSLVFNEEFEQGELDRTRWKTALPWGENETINAERQYFVNIFGNNPTGYDPFVLTGSTLEITGVPTPADVLGQANGLPYLSGVITTSDYFRMTYGYVEMSAKVASGTGLLSTFYLFNQDFEKNKPEIDILEYIGNRPDKAYQTYHYYDSNRARYASGEKHSSPTMEHIASGDLSAGFHTYGVLWEENLMVWYIDGVEVRRITGPRVSDEPMNIIAQLVIGSEWIGAPDPSSIPAKFTIDYIKAWQRNQ